VDSLSRAFNDCASEIKPNDSINKGFGLSTPEFDRIADIYDETRRALDVKTLAGITGVLARHHCRSLLEIGVGTGRISAPLAKTGIALVGMDISRRMMEKARVKGLGDLVLAEGKTAPFKEKSFDGVVMAHVFHLLEEPVAVMREAARVSKVGVFALLRKREGDRVWFPFYGAGDMSSPPGGGSSTDPRTKFLEERRERFRKIADRYNWKWDSSRFRNWRREREILESYPPDEFKTVSDVIVTETIEDRIARYQKGGYGFMSEMPPGMKEEIINEMRASASTFQQLAGGPRHEIYQVAFWRSGRLLGTKEGKKVATRRRRLQPRRI
jgi:SAM-dependent methyltransferase